MKSVLIERCWFGPFGTFGRLSVHDDDTQLFWCHSLEPLSFPWAPSNTRDVSCIPVGEYKIERGIYRRNTATPDDDYPCFVIADGEVWGRGRAIGDAGDVSGLKIHAGNELSNTLGCPLTGTSLGLMNGAPAVLASRKALRAALKAFGTGDAGSVLRVTEMLP